MQSCEISQNRYKCYNPLPKTHGSTTTTTVDCSNETIYGQNIPRMKLLKINYVNPDLSKHNPCLDTTTFQITDNIKPSFYKYAVYKKLNGDNQQNRLQNYNKNNLMSNDENPRVHKDRNSYPAQNSGQILLLNSNSNHRPKIKVHHSPRDTWNIKMIADTPLNQSGIKTRATRLENIEKGSCSNEMLKFNKSDEITQISKIFEHARKEQQSITPSCNNSSKISSSSSILSSSSSILSSSTTTGDKKIKKLADDLQFNCYCSNMKNLNENSSHNKKKVTANPQNFCTSECRTKMKSPSSSSTSSSIQPLNKFDEGVNNNNKIQKLFDLIPPDDQQDRLLQEKILHHHQRLNRNQDRITDLKKYAKRSNSMSNHCPMERIHLRKTAAKRRQPLLVTSDAEMNIDNSKKIDQPLTNKIKLEQQSFRNTCGYHQNCKFSQCPISNETGSMVQDHGKDFTTSKYINMSPPQAVLDKVISSPLQDIKISSSSVQEKFNDLNDVQNFSGKSVTKVTTDEMLMSSTLNNTVNKNPKHKSDIDVNLKNNENRKFNDLRSGSGSGGIGVRHSLKNSSLSSHSLSSDTTSTSTESDYSYYDQAAASVVSTEDTPSTDNLDCRVSDNLQIQDVLRPKLGCDGAIFWNNCYFYDDSFCTKCSFTSSDCRDFQPVNYICFCSSRKTDIHDLRPRSLEGGIDSGISFNGDSGSSPDCDLHSQQDTEARRLKRGHVLTELLETERIYVTEMNSILRGYRDQMLSEEMAHLVPASLQGKEDVLFGNLHELYTFHSEIFLKDLENCISTTELVALCFVQRRDTFYRLYSFYCQNIPRSERLRETLVDTHLFLQECQKRLGHKLPLAAYLLKPVQRITKYQLLLKDLLRFSDSGTCTKELQKALDCMLIVLKCVNDSMHQIAITGFPADLSQQGELLLQDSFQVWTESKKDIRLRLKTQHRHIFLYQKAMLFCKQASKTGHNKSTYQFKHYLKMSQIGLTESVRGDPKRFEVWLQGRQEVHTIQAPNVEIKNKWVSEIKRVLLNQLEELKGEKIKQYGLNHRPLRQTVSWDTPASNLSTPQRTMSCDTAEANRTTNGSDECPPQTPGISSSSSEKDNPDVGGWSSDYSNSEDELSIIEDNSTPGSRFIALADYCAVGHSEVSMKEGDTVELLKIGCAGWWFVKVLGSNAEGWTPAAYLEPTNRKSSRSSSRNQDRIN